jgi:hypothetical protein
LGLFLFFLNSTFHFLDYGSFGASPSQEKALAQIVSEISSSHKDSYGSLSNSGSSTPSQQPLKKPRISENVLSGAFHPNQNHNSSTPMNGNTSSFQSPNHPLISSHLAQLTSSQGNTGGKATFSSNSIHSELIHYFI